MRINQNIMAFNAYRNLSGTNDVLGKSLEKLSSGFRINRAADDAAGLVVSEGLRAQVSGLRVATRNAQDGVSVVQTAEGALTEVHSMLRRMRDLALQASNTGANDSNARTAAQTEIDQLSAEITRIGNTTRFGGVKLLDGTYGVSNAITGASQAFPTAAIAAGDDFVLSNVAGLPSVTVELQASAGFTAAGAVTELNRALRAALLSVGGTGNEVQASIASQSGANAALRLSGPGSFTVAEGTNTPLAAFGITAGNSAASGTGGIFQVGANNGESITVNISDVRAAALGVSALDVSSNSLANTAVTLLDTAISTVSTQRANLGAVQNRFESTIANLSVTTENLAASESRIRDTDMALELVSFTRHQVLQQAGTAMLAQANQVPQSVLSLLRSVQHVRPGVAPSGATPLPGPPGRR